MARVNSLGALTGSIAHEVNQPLSGIITNASTCLRMLSADPPNVDGARETARRTIRDGNRASEVIAKLRALFGKKDIVNESVDLNEATREVIALSLSELQRKQVNVWTEFDDELPLVTGDRVQLQQVVLNLLLNASDAMSGVDDRPRRIVIKTGREKGESVRLTVQDTGVGFDPQNLDESLTRSTPPRVPVWGLDYPSVAPLSKVIMAAFGPHRTMAPAPRFHSRFRVCPRARPAAEVLTQFRPLL